MRSLFQQAALCAALAGAVGSAHAVSVDTDGFGQVLIYPYYNVNSGNQTIFSIINTTDRGKAIKVRFREALNGRDALEFNLYLDAQDTWTGAIFATDQNGPANLVVADSACTVPTIAGSTSLPSIGGNRYVAFRNFGYAFNNDDAGPDEVARTREGFFELIEMGTLRPGTPSADSAGLGSNGQPRNCASLNAAWIGGGYWTTDPTRDLDPPSGGLIGNASVVDVADGTLYAARPVALAGFRDTVLHGAPGVETPTLGDARSAGDTAIAEVQINGKRATSTYPAARAIDAVSAVLQSEQLINEFSREAGLGARTDWVVTMPTKQFYADAARAGANAIAPFTGLFPAAGTPGCERAALAPLDRATRGPARGCATGVTDPGSCQLPDTALCAQVQVLSFGSSGSPLASSNAAAVPNAAQLPETGYARLDLGNQGAEAHALRASNEGHVYRGLPAIGFTAVEFVNGNLGGGSTLANYSDASAHRTVRECKRGEAGGSCSP